MSNYNDVRTALGAAIQQFQPGLNVYYYVPQSLVPPAAIVKPQSQNVRTIEYLQTQSSGLAKWHFQVLLVIGQLDEQAAQEQAGELISPGSPLLRALNNVRLSTGFSQVTEGGISSMMFDQGLYTYAQLTVVVTA